MANTLKSGVNIGDADKKYVSSYITDGCSSHDQTLTKIIKNFKAGDMVQGVKVLVTKSDTLT